MRPRNNDLPGPQPWASMYNFPVQEPGFLEEMTDSWAEAEKYIANEEYFLITESKKKKMSKPTRGVSESSGTSL